MIGTAPKPMQEVEAALEGKERIVVLGCGGCAKVCHTGGEPEVAQMADDLKKVGAVPEVPLTVDHTSTVSGKSGSPSAIIADGADILSLSDEDDMGDHHLILIKAEAKAAAAIKEPMLTVEEAEDSPTELTLEPMEVNSVDESGIDEGTEFKIYLPAEEGQVVEKIKVKTDIKDFRTSEKLKHILLVDDNVIVLKTGKKILEKIGYSVTTAENGKEALEKFSQSPEDFDLVILDIIMPEMSGEKAFYALRDIRPDIPVILATGYSADWKTREMLQHGVTSFLQKPYSLNELNVAISEIISKLEKENQ